MKILYQISFNICLFCVFFLSFGYYSFALPLEGDIYVEKSSVDSLEVDEEKEELSFETDESNELELKSADEVKDDRAKSIKELQSEALKGESDKRKLTDQFEFFIRENGKLKVYFRDNLSNEDLVGIEKTIGEYNIRRIKLESELKEKAEKFENTDAIEFNLLEIKRELYKSFSEYIDPEKIEGYKNFIKVDAINTKKNKNIQSDIYRVEKIKEEKRNFYIEKHEKIQKEINLKLNQAIEDKIKKKLSQYRDSKKFEELGGEKQKFIFEQVLLKIEKRREDLERTEGGLIDSKKVNLYLIMEKVLTEFISDLKK